MTTSGRDRNGFQNKACVVVKTSFRTSLSDRTQSQSTKSCFPDASGKMVSLKHQQKTTNVSTQTEKQRESICKLDIKQALLLRLTGVTISQKAIHLHTVRVATHFSTACCLLNYKRDTAC